MHNRFDLKRKLSLTVLPTLMLGTMLFLLEHYSHQHLLFASLASSTFSIYLNPHHRTNNVKTLCIAQISAALIGWGTVSVIGPGYLSAVIGMGLAIGLMILLNAIHPPAVSTGLAFAFERGKTLPLFLIAVGLLAMLILLQTASLWLINRYAKAQPKTNPDHEPRS